MELHGKRFRTNPGKTAQRQQAAERTRMAPFLRALKAIHSVSTPDNPLDPQELEKQRHTQEVLGRLAAPMNGMTWEPFRLEDMDAAWVRVDRTPYRRHAILYCHGGGYTSGNLGYSRVLASKLASSTGYEVLTFEYRLAPEHRYPAAVEDALRAWDFLLARGYAPDQIVVAGDSAGGNLSLVLCHRLKTAGRDLPAALLLFSPWTDMTATGDSYRERAQLDPMLTAEYIRAVRDAYAPGADYTLPDLSPLFADFRDFPPTLIQVGSHEILYSDAQRLHTRMEKAGVTSRLEEYGDMWHVFQMFPTRKSAQAMDNVTRFLLELL